jgi:hypothetical protein
MHKEQQRTEAKPAAMVVEKNGTGGVDPSQQAGVVPSGSKGADSTSKKVDTTVIQQDTAHHASTAVTAVTSDSSAVDTLKTAVVSDTASLKDSLSTPTSADSSVVNSNPATSDSLKAESGATALTSDSSAVKSDSGTSLMVVVPDSAAVVDSLKSQQARAEATAKDSSTVKPVEQVADQKKKKNDKEYKATGLGVMLMAGSTGPQIGITGSLHQFLHCSRPLNVRANFSYLQYKTEVDKTVSDQDLAININSRVSSANLLLDFHPLKNWLRVTAGAFFSFTETKTKMRSKEGKSIGMITVTPEEMGDLEFTFSRNPVEPYFGIGIGNTMEKRVNFLMDLGVAYTGPLNVKGKGSGMIGPSAENAQSMQTVFEKHNELFWWPVLSLGLGIKLF